MNKLLIKKILISSAVGGGLITIVYQASNYIGSDTKKNTIPTDLVDNANRIEPDQAFAALFKKNNIKLDPVSDMEAQKILFERTANNDSSSDNSAQSEKKEERKKEEINNNVVEVKTEVEVDPKSFFSPTPEKNAKITHADIRTVLTNSDTPHGHKDKSNQTFSDNWGNNTNLQRQVASAPAPAPASQEQETPVKKPDKGSLLLSANGKLASLVGRDVSIGGADYQIKAGTRVLALLSDGLTITSNAPQHTSLRVIGPLDDFSFPENYIITATATLNPSEDKINIQTNLCSSRNIKTKSTACKGVIKDIRGYTGLTGDIYNQSFWSAVVAFVGSTLAAIPLSQIERSATINGTVENVSVANTIKTSLAQGIQSVTANIQKGFDKSGTQITIPQNSIVQIMFTDDTLL